jgi:ABC-type transport system involved in Fe-S cluster assembly fused permease/ATPase subunit
LVLLQVQKALIDMENMFELLATTPAVADQPGARSLRVTEGRVDFKEVRTAAAKHCFHRQKHSKKYTTRCSCISAHGS